MAYSRKAPICHTTRLPPNRPVSKQLSRHTAPAHGDISLNITNGLSMSARPAGLSPRSTEDMITTSYFIWFSFLWTQGADHTDHLGCGATPPRIERCFGGLWSMIHAKMLHEIYKLHHLCRIQTHPEPANRSFVPQ